MLMSEHFSRFSTLWVNLIFSSTWLLLPSCVWIPTILRMMNHILLWCIITTCLAALESVTSPTSTATGCQQLPAPRPFLWGLRGVGTFLRQDPSPTGSSGSGGVIGSIRWGPKAVLKFLPTTRTGPTPPNRIPTGRMTTTGMHASRPRSAWLRPRSVTAMAHDIVHVHISFFSVIL